MIYEVKMLINILLLCTGLMILVWSADKFVDASAHVARHFNMPSLLIGMLIVGFGTSAPELTVSLFAAIQNNPGIAIGNAYGSNIANIAMILGISSVIMPISIHSSVLKKELPILSMISFISFFLLRDKTVSRLDSIILLLLFAGLMIWSIRTSRHNKNDSLADEVSHKMPSEGNSISKSFFCLFTGLVLLISSSRLLIWSAVNIARMLGLSDLIIGLTIVAVGTSLPELASSVIASRKGEHDIALGNILGSNLFNTLAVVGLAGTVKPFKIGDEVIKRDIPVMIVLTLSIFIVGYGFRKRPGRINRFEGTILLLAYVLYTLFLFL